MTNSGTADIRAAVEARSRQFEDAYRAGDAERLVTSYFTADRDEPMAFPPGGQGPVRGRAALIAMFSGMIPEMPSIRLELVELVTSEALAFEVGRAHLSAPDGTVATGRYTVCWQNVSGDWRARVDFFAQDGWAD
jgi:ketosteroid isomerase-like protein